MAAENGWYPLPQVRLAERLRTLAKSRKADVKQADTIRQKKLDALVQEYEAKMYIRYASNLF
jgi:hypothetical protein